MRRIRFFFLGIVCALLMGCTGDVYQPATVDVAVEIPCRPPAVAVPDFPLKAVPIAAPVDTKVKAALVEIYLRRIYEDQLVAAIKACGG